MTACGNNRPNLPPCLQTLHEPFKNSQTRINQAISFLIDAVPSQLIGLSQRRIHRRNSKSIVFPLPPMECPNGFYKMPQGTCMSLGSVTLQLNFQAISLYLSLTKENSHEKKWLTRKQNFEIFDSDILEKSELDKRRTGLQIGWRKVPCDFSWPGQKTSGSSCSKLYLVQNGPAVMTRAGIYIQCCDPNFPSNSKAGTARPKHFFPKSQSHRTLITQYSEFPKKSWSSPNHCRKTKSQCSLHLSEQ